MASNEDKDRIRHLAEQIAGGRGSDATNDADAQ